MIVINFILMIIITGLFLYSIGSLFSLLKKMITIKSLDELQRKRIYETFSISFAIILLVHFVQLVFSLLGKDISLVISAGFYKGALISNNPLHMDSFVFDLIIYSVVDISIKRKYDVLSKRDFLLKFVLPVLILLGVTTVLGVMLFFEYR